MRRPAIIAIVLLVAGLGWRACRTPGPGDWVNLPPTATGPWVAFGDSLTEGFGAERGQDYPTVLGRKLGVEIRNLGVSGNTTHDGLARLGDALRLKPQVVLLCLGGNDSLRQMPKEQAFANLGRMIDAFHAAGSFVVLIGVRSSGLRDKYAEQFEQLAKEKKVMLVPNLLDGVLFSPGLMSDTIHPNSKGYEQIAERFFTELAPVLPKLTAANSP